MESNTCMRMEYDCQAFGSNNATTCVTAVSLHDDFVNLMRSQGLEKMAADAGMLQNGQLRHVSIQNPMQQSHSPIQSPILIGKKRKYAKMNRGLRHFSMKVCQKVEEKVKTSYNEVADELVQEFVTMRPNDAVYDEKNIRRRVYDALNVLMAMNIISKERKEIHWKGFPVSSHPNTELLVMERDEKVQSIARKKRHLEELLLQNIAMQRLRRRNSQRSGTLAVNEERISLPFIVVSTQKDTIIQCEMSEDRKDIFFNFSAPFEINDDTEILRRLKLHRCSRKEMEDMIPKEMQVFVSSDCLED